MPRVSVLGTLKRFAELVRVVDVAYAGIRAACAAAYDGAATACAVNDALADVYGFYLAEAYLRGVSAYHSGLYEQTLGCDGEFVGMHFQVCAYEEYKAYGQCDEEEG